MLCKTPGLAHQVADLAMNGRKKAWGRLWEMGVGKTWPTLVEAAQLYLDNLIDVLIVVAPKAVAINWVADQIPQHLPDEVNAYCHAYELPKAKTTAHRQGVARLLEHWRQRRGLVVLSVSYEGVMDEECKELIKLLISVEEVVDGKPRRVGTGRAMAVADESSYIANDGAKRTQRMYSIGALCEYRRILEGTPGDDPRKFYSQMKFLDPNFWVRHRINSLKAFETTFCKIVKSKNLTTKIQRGGRTIEVQVPRVVGFQNLDQLKRMVLEGASRLTTEDAGIHLPEKTYQRLKFELTPKQRQIYEQLRLEYMVELASGHFMAAPLAMVRLLRLQQVTSGYLPFEDETGDLAVVEIMPPKQNPRLERVLEHLELVPHQTIVFARFTPEVDMLLDALPSIRKKAVRFDGRTSDKERARSLEAFKAGDADFMVGKVGAMGRGLTLVNGKRTTYYSNDFSWMNRAQSEKRVHRIGQVDPCFYDDLQATRTVDDRIIKSLISKNDIAAQITGDTLKEWLTEC
jgi:SNF2 family DNA or RNA helicase